MTTTLVKGNMIGHKILEARTKQGLSQVELAASMCVDQGISMERATISQIERGLRSVKDKEIDAFCDVLKVTPNWLFGRKG